MDSKKILITAALPYANGKVHIGHFAGVYLPADVFARFCRFVGRDVLFLCASDEYGFAVSISAEKRGISVNEHASHYHEVNKSVFDRMKISCDFYSRTTSESHVKPVQMFFSDLLTAGLIEEKESYQLFSEQEGRFLADRYVTGVCPICGNKDARGDECVSCGGTYESIDLIDPVSVISSDKLEKRLTTHWFLKLDLFRDRLLRWLDTKDWKPSVLNFLKKYCEDLKPRAITRDSNWGVPVPSDCGIDSERLIGKVLYVWFDAPIGYISSAIDWSLYINKPDKWKEYWLNDDVKLVQFLGKDNMVFHGIIFPAMVMGQSLPVKLVDDMPVSDFYKFEGNKISKSAGNYVDIDFILDEFGLDQLRFFLCATAPESSDSDFKWVEFQSKCNSELVGKLGNFVNRVTTFLHRNREGVVPKVLCFSQEDELALGKAKAFMEEIFESYDSYKLRKAVQLVFDICNMANNYFDKNHPWVLVRSGDSDGRLDSVLFVCLEFIRLLAIAINPILPDSSEKMWQHIGGIGSILDDTWSNRLSQTVMSGAVCCKPFIIFPKIDDVPEVDIVSADQEDSKPLEILPSYVSINQFSALDIRVGKILEAFTVEKSSKLLRLMVDIGEKHVQIMSGIAQTYSAEEIVGKTVLVVTNLKPVKIMGYESNGMVLVAEHEGTISIVGQDHLVPGSKLT